jgi:glycosyltransferase involved in cell wall biosynthesis
MAIPERHQGASTRSTGPVKTVSVILPTFNAERWIRDQLAALSEQKYTGEWELIVADNGSTDGTRSVALGTRQRFPRFNLIDASGVRGPSHARNQGVLAASGDFLLFTDADDIVRPGWIAQLTEGLRNSSIVTGPVEHFADGRTPTWDNAQRSHERPRTGPFTQFVPVSGCNMGITRELLFELGGFDESLPFGWGDLDLSIRAKLRGLSVGWVEHAIVRRRRPSSVRAMWNKEFIYGRGWTTLERRYSQLTPRGWMPLLRRLVWIVLRAPYLVLRDRRRGWVMKAAQLTGRLVERLHPST